MKKTKKYVLRTLVTLHVSIVLFIGVSRAFEDVSGEYTPERTSAQVLATLGDFNSIQISGYLDLEIVQQSEYQIDYSPLIATAARFSASVEDGLLTIRGHGSNQLVERGRVRIGLPSLASLNASNVPTLSINELTQDSLSLTTDNVRAITLSNVQLDSLQLNAARIDRIDLRDAELNSRTITIRNVGSIGLSLQE